MPYKIELIFNKKHMLPEVVQPVNFNGLDLYVGKYGESAVSIKSLARVRGESYKTTFDLAVKMNAMFNTQVNFHAGDNQPIVSMKTVYKLAQWRI